MSKKRLWIALAAYEVLGLAAFTLREIKLRQVVWIFLAGFAVKSWIAASRTDG